MGEVLICRDYLNIEGGTLTVKFDYEIIEVLNKSLKLQKVTTSDTYDVPINLIRSHFPFNYYCTCHNMKDVLLESPLLCLFINSFLC